MLWLSLIVLTAVFLRLWQIDTIPPGLTHDEADHGITAWSIVEGERAIYFTVGYGREPLFDYATAAVMSLLGPTYLAGRLTAVFFSIITLIFLYLWVRHAFDTPTALITVAGFAVGFWSVMTGRQALRSITLGAFFVGGMWAYFWGISSIIMQHYPQNNNQSIPDSRSPTPNLQPQLWLPFILSGLLLGLAFYTYIPARALWFVIPSGLLYLLIVDRKMLQRVWWQTAVALIISLFVGAPLFSYLQNNPQVEVRIQELSAPLTAIREGDFRPLLQNMIASLRLFVIEGDTAWRYNIAGMPFLPIMLAPFFILGAGLLIWWTIRPFRQKDKNAVWQGFASWLALVWFGVGFAPVLITGPELSTTQAIGMQPMLYLLTAIGIERVRRQVSGIRYQVSGGTQHATRNTQHATRSTFYTISLALPIILFSLTAVFTWRNYIHWGHHPEVRVQYESTMATAMDYVNKNLGEAAVSISTITPGQFHTPALAQMRLTVDNEPRWFNASSSLLIPNTPTSTVILPGFTPLHEGLADYFETAVLQTTLPLQENDLDRPLDIYAIDLNEMWGDWQQDFEIIPSENPPIFLDENLQLLGFEVQNPEVPVGEHLRVATLWQVVAPIQQETKLFTQVIGEHNAPIGQADRLDAPSESWQKGDYLIQLHEILMTEEMVGKRPLFIGGYTCTNGCETYQTLPFYYDTILSASPETIGHVEVVP